MMILPGGILDMSILMGSIVFYMVLALIVVAALDLVIDWWMSL